MSWNALRCGEHEDRRRRFIPQSCTSQRNVAAVLASGIAAFCLATSLAVAQEQTPAPPAAPATQAAPATPEAPTTPEAPATAVPSSGTVLPEIKVTTQKKPPAPPPKRSAAKRTQPPATQASTEQATPPSGEEAPPSGGEPGPLTPTQAALSKKMQQMDQAREKLLPKVGASSYTLSRDTIESLPQGDNTPIDKVILQAPGVSLDSAVSNPSYHIRNEYANAQYRINGIILPEGVSGLGPVIDAGFAGSLSILTGTLPAQYGLRTAGVIDITSRAFSSPSGTVSVYGGSRDAFTTSFDYGAGIDNSQFFVTARGNWNNEGLENPAPTLNAIHDHTDQGKFFGYLSTLLDDSTRFSVITGASYSKFQIPGNPGQVPLGDFGPAVYDSTTVNEEEYDRFQYNLAALQTKGPQIDTQFALYSRYASVHFIPDIVGDLVFNDVASDVTRESQLYGAQFDADYHLNNSHEVRFGFDATAEKTNVINVSTLLPGDIGAVTGPPFTVVDADSLLGWNIGAYVQDEWKLTDTLTLNYGLRFDELIQFVEANQFSPRMALVYKPEAGTTIHAGYARYFTPPMQAQATQSNLALVANTTNQPDVPLDDPVRPERSHYFDVGVDKAILPDLDAGIDAYYKIATDQLDDGQFGQAVVLTQFNFAKGYSRGAEFKLKYHAGNLKAYANFSYNVTEATDVISNQYLIDAATYNYLLYNYHYTDDMQLMTGSAGVSYRWNKTVASADLIYGSGLRAGFVNVDHSTPYAVINTGISQEFEVYPGLKPTIVRFDIVNLLDQVYELRTGTGIGEFAPQYGARRGYFIGISQKF
jgi:outer membrane receptor protein involved in Fe transport